MSVESCSVTTRMQCSKATVVVEEARLPSFINVLDDRNWWVVGFGRFLAAFKTSEMNVFSNMWYLTAGFAVVASKQAKKEGH